MKIIVNKTCATVSGAEMLTSGMVGKTIDVEFSTEWAELIKVAVFTNGAVTKDVINPTGTIIIPWEVLEHSNKRVSVGFYGYKLEDGEKVLAIPTVWAELGTVRAGADPSGDPSAEISATVAEQILEVANSAEEKAQSVVDAAERGDFDGEDGEDGYSPTIEVEDIEGGHRITITDESGTRSFDILDGTDGVDGVSPTVEVTEITGGHKITITDADGTQTFSVMNGTDGTDGRDGTDGTDGVSPTVSVTEIVGGHNVAITDADGTQSFDVMDGESYDDTELRAEIEGKVDKVSGKGLSSNDYTNEDKAKVASAVQPSALTDYALKTDLENKQNTINDLATIRSGAALGATAVQPEAGKGLFSGNYNDLTNKPTIPSAVTESTVSGWGFTKNTGTYSKPSGGIPKTDLASDVQTSLGKADTALQSHQDISGKSDVVISSVSNITPTQVATAISQGKTVVITASHATFGSLSFEAWNVATDFNLVISNTTSWVLNSWATISLQGNLSNNTWQLDSTYIATSQDVDSKLDISQGVAHAGEFLIVGNDGNVTTQTLAAWQGGSY